MAKRALTITADLLLILAAAAGIWRMWDAHRRESAALAQEDPSAQMLGKTLTNVDVDWNKTGTNLVMILNKDCHFCSESAPFYQRLIASTGSQIQVAALFPHDVPAARTYLDSLGVGISVVRGPVSFPWPLMTPTLMLCDAKGKISRVWIGKLTTEQESEVLSAVANTKAASGRELLLHGAHRNLRWFYAAFLAAFLWK
jgi:hypothetical protein